MDIVKNPVIIALIAGVITYAYLLWETNQDKKKKKKHKKNGKGVNLGIVLLVSCLSWFLSYNYLEPEPRKITSIPQTFMRGGNVGMTMSDESFSLLKNGINVPESLPELNLPDTLLEMN